MLPNAIEPAIQTGYNLTYCCAGKGHFSGADPVHERDSHSCLVIWLS